MISTLKGKTTPRLFTPPLRELTPETSRGFEVIAFALEILGVHLYPWQEWLLIHALELNVDGTYRFKRVIVLVARQQGKTMLSSVLAAWWLFVDSKRNPDRVPPLKFKIVGVAQSLDIAREPWNAVKLWCDPDPETDEEQAAAVPDLQAVTQKALDSNGKEMLRARNLAHYEVRAATNTRGKPAARVIFDELREQKTWAAWAAVSQTAKSFWSGQMWGISNAGDALSVVLWKLREAALATIADWESYVDSGLQQLEEFANGHDMSLGIFEWSAPEGCGKEDVEGILQANPSIGYGAMTVADAIADARTMPDAEYRTEVLCQWVTANLRTYLSPTEWGDLVDEESQIDPGSDLCLAIDTAHDRSHTYIAVAGWRADDLAHVEVIADRAGMLWAPGVAREIREKWGMRRVALQARGAPAHEFIAALREEGFDVVEIGGSDLGSATGRIHDRVRDKTLRHLGQPNADIAVSGAVTKTLGDMQVWDRKASPVDISPLVAESYALFGLETGEGPAAVSAYTAVGGETLGDWWEED
ncbi:MULTISPECIES: hypothetical protein [unclassified Microbacterium]|uniref:hypothetical protein n=1 Tax=unclassified Microbacterium TaxID=2609290 RepID=UPI0034382A9B